MSERDNGAEFRALVEPLERDMDMVAVLGAAIVASATRTPQSEYDAAFLGVITTVRDEMMAPERELCVADALQRHDIRRISRALLSGHPRAGSLLGITRAELADTYGFEEEEADQVICMAMLQELAIEHEAAKARDSATEEMV